MAVINVSNLTYTYPLTETPVLRDISFSAQEGEFVSVIGPDGSGRSTLAYALAGFIPHFYKGQMSGTVEIDGVDTASSTLDQLVLKVGLAFQNPFNQISGAKYTVYEEIAFGLENLGVPREEMPARIEEGMALTGISNLADRSPYSLSGGQQQRVALASILVMKPRVLVLDEPTSQLDPIGSREVFAVVKKMSQQGMTVVMVEQKVEWIAAFSTRVIALENGRVVADGTAQQVLTDEGVLAGNHPVSRYTLAARAGREQGSYKNTELPIQLEQAVKGFRR
jgi:energy-coupling factor transporter ATP-binding protein EcfA2